MARRRSASGSHSSAEMRWRRARGRRSLSTGTMFNTQITLRKSIVWAEVVGFGFPSFTLWESCFHGAADSCSLTFSFREFPPSPRLLFPLIRDIKVMKNLSALIEPAATMNQFIWVVPWTLIFRGTLSVLMSEMSTSLWFVRSGFF